VEVTWDVQEMQGVRKLPLEWAERGGPVADESQREGFGSTLLQKVLPRQSGAEVDVEFAPTGMTFKMVAPMIERRPVPELLARLGIARLCHCGCSQRALVEPIDVLPLDGGAQSLER
jgi:hypothetical protein